MTRLIEDWIESISTSMKDYEFDLIKKTGLNLIDLASSASEVPIDKLTITAQNTKVGVIPFTAGLGVIGSFAESVAAVCRSMNFNAFVTEEADASGIYEACLKGAEVLFMADDHNFIALNVKTGVVAENSQATAKGFVAALRETAGGLKDRQVLVIGCGVVGQEALHILKMLGARPVAYDHNTEVLSNMAEKGYETIQNVGQIAGYPLVFDASSSGDWLGTEMLHPDVFIAAPGVPLSLNQEAYERHGVRLIHDYLPIGVATMLALAYK